MKATFDVAGDGEFPQPSFEIAICFNGVPGTVILEINKMCGGGYSGESGNPVSTVSKRLENVMRAPLKASHARAIASALLSAATEVRQ